MENVLKALDNLVCCVKNSEDYKKCNRLKKRMDDNPEIVELIKEVKRLQKKYIQASFDSGVKEELDKQEKKLFDIPIYQEYYNSLENVNMQIDFIRDSINDYFYKLLNPEEKDY